MLSSYDVGSLPLRVDEPTIWDGARRSQTLLSLVGVSDEVAEVFEALFRVLKSGGRYIFYDIHPFQRPWADDNSSNAKGNRCGKK